MKIIGKLFFALSWILFFSSQALAEGYALIDWSARGVSLGGAMVARADDPSAIAYNPAGITQLEGTQLMFGAAGVMPHATIETQFRGVTKEDDPETKVWTVPHFYLTHQLSDKAWIGAGVYTRFGLGGSYPENWPGRNAIIKVDLQTMSFNPNFAYKITDNLSAAVGLEVMAVTMNMVKGLPYNKNRAKLQIKGDGYTFGATAGLRYRINDQFALGFSYKSQTQQRVHGKTRMKNMPISMPKMNTRAKVTLPDTFGFAVLYRPAENWSVEAGTTYTRWESYKSLNIYVDGLPASKSYKGWDNTFNFNLGVEHQWNDWLTLRAGYLYDAGPENSEHMDYLVPSMGRHHFAVGTGFAFDNWTIDLAYDYIWIKGGDYNFNGEGVLDGKVKDGRAHVFALSAGYKF